MNSLHRSNTRLTIEQRTASVDPTRQTHFGGRTEGPVDLIKRLLAAINAHDLDAAAALFHEDYRSQQPAHPGRAFTGRAQMHANWAAIFAGVPDFHAELTRCVQDDETVWSEWSWSGRRTDGVPFEMQGVTLFHVRDEFIVEGRLYMEEVETAPIGIDEVVEEISGERPQESANTWVPSPVF